MSTNLHAMIRYRALDKSFRERRRNKTWEDLAEACGDAIREYDRSDMKSPSRRSIFGDLETMKSGKLGYEAPIVHSRKLGYHYSDPDFSISKHPLTTEDKTNLEDALFILKSNFGDSAICPVWKGSSHIWNMGFLERPVPLKKPCRSTSPLKCRDRNGSTLSLQL
ncbi:MAG: hypothetical protein IPJ06_00245 [Saprospiraceae bacterium]|nr:hypothetical protein [Saprospiraceae bacterium]